MKAALNPLGYSNLGWLSAGLCISGAAHQKSGTRSERWTAGQAVKFLAKQKKPRSRAVLLAIL